MTNNDLDQIGALMDKKLKTLEGKLIKEISSTEEKLDKRISATEESLRMEILVSNNKLKEELLDSDKRFKKDIEDFMENTLLPWINDRFDETADKTDIERIEGKLDKFIDTGLDHERRIKNIESVPVVVHELKCRKSKLS